MLEEKNMPILNKAQVDQIELELKHATLKRESADTTIVQLNGTLLRGANELEHVVIALHMKDEANQYVHLQQYEFEYHIDQLLEKNINISVLVLSELNENMKYQLEIKLLAEQDKQQWYTMKSYITTLK